MSIRSKKVTEPESLRLSFNDDALLWPEWSDAALNKENWTASKNGPDSLFLDAQPVPLPPSLVPHEWIRAKDLPNLIEPLTVYVPGSGYSDLITNNKHLLHSEFARWFVSALINLEHCGRNGLEISGENSNFIWNGRYQSWRGWMNVYSMNKAGKGVQHKPGVNLNGKYVIRVYFLGCWRYVEVDDTIPVNTEGIPLLLRTSNDFELWPMLLSKALLKLASLTWTEHREIVDFHPVTCLTGWVCLRLDIAYLSPQDKWDFLRKYADHFEWQAETPEQENQEAAEVNKKGKRSKDTVRSKKSKDTGRSKKSKDTSRSKKSKDTERSKKSKDTEGTKKSGQARKLKALSKPQPVTLFLGLEDMREVPLEVVPGLSPCWGHFIYVEQSRDIPLDPKDVKPPLARWKLYRWLRWAINEGIIDPAEYFVPIRSLKVVSPLKKCKESVINKYNDLNMEQNLQNELNQQSKFINSSKEPPEKNSMEETEEEISFWADFNKMEPHVRDIHFFYKLDYFQYTVKLSDRFKNNQSSEQKSETKKNSRKSSPSRATYKDPEVIGTYNWPQKMSRTRNEPLYILTDSLEEKFFLIDFSTFQVVNSPKENDIQTNSPAMQTGDMDYLSLEKHNWFRRPEKSNRLLSMLTAGTKSVVIELDAGRHLLRMYCRSESNCFITISSDTIFHVGDRRKMYQLMSGESQRIDHLTKHISNCVSNAYQSFGTEKYQEALKNYYRSYLPPIQDPEERNKLFYDQIHDYFLDEKVQLIRKAFTDEQVPDVLRSLRIFFLNPTIGLERFNVISRLIESLQDLNESKDPFESNNDNSDKEKLEEDQAATIIQSFFKMLIIRKYKQIHDPQHKQHQRVLDNLSKIVELFNYDKRESLANQLLRNILKHHDRLSDAYPFSKDCEHTLQVQEVKGVLTNVKPNQWLPMPRLVVNCRVTETVLAGIDMFVDLPRYSVRVFNNDTGREMSRVVNNVVSTWYQHSRLGYTIVCYGWSKEFAFKELPWSLNVITVKQQPVFYSTDTESPLSLTTALPILMVEEFSNNYVPNSQNYISKLIVRVAKPSIVSFRLKTTYENVRMKFTVTDKQGNVVARVTSTSVVILPMVYLGLDEESNQIENNADKKLPNGRNNEEDSMESRSRESLDYKTYYVQATVLDDSWPLTQSEWIVVMEIREGTAMTDIRSKQSSVSQVSKLIKSEFAKGKKSSKQQMDGQNLEPPYWVLQVVTDVGSGLEISQDRTKEQEIAQMKEDWAKENPDSLARGRVLRAAFLKKHEIKSNYSLASLKRRSLTTPEKSLTKCHRTSITDSRMISLLDYEPRTLKPPSFLRRLPPLDLTIYEVKEDEEDIPWVRTEQDEETLRSSRVMNIIYAKEDHAHFVADLQDILQTRKDRYKQVFSDYKDLFWEYKILMEEAHEARNSYVSNMKRERIPVSKKASSRKSKKSKKT
nr:androglobin-like isoform X2 [Osmia lignaria]